MKVYIVGSNGNCQYAEMYRDAGYEVVFKLEAADIVQFTGGSDVSPYLYKEFKHPTTMNNMERDVEEAQVYNSSLATNKFMVGICRGAQFLNVMNNGGLYQNVDNHALGGTHEAVDDKTGRVVNVTSTHHQMMRPTSYAIILCTAALAEHKEHMIGGNIRDAFSVWEDDFEAVYYKDTKCLCFQPHPEFGVNRAGDTREYFFELLNRYVGE
jgi:gamma-glutamyl-gamma-aminobutyrate hydrolase PuuD